MIYLGCLLRKNEKRSVPSVQNRLLKSCSELKKVRCAFQAEPVTVKMVNICWKALTQRCTSTLLLCSFFNPFVPNAPFLYPLKTENLTVFCFQGVEKGSIGNKWVKCTRGLVHSNSKIKH